MFNFIGEVKFRIKQSKNQFLHFVTKNVPFKKSKKFDNIVGHFVIF